MILHLLRHFVGDAFNSISTLHVCPLLCSYCALPLSPPLGVTHDPHNRINMLIPSSSYHIESRQSHRWAQRKQTARTTTPCSRSTCSTARGSSSPGKSPGSSSSFQCSRSPDYNGRTVLPCTWCSTLDNSPIRRI